MEDQASYTNNGFSVWSEGEGGLNDRLYNVVMQLRQIRELAVKANNSLADALDGPNDIPVTKREGDDTRLDGVFAKLDDIEHSLKSIKDEQDSLHRIIINRL